MQKLLTHSDDPEHPWPSSFLHVPPPSHEFVPVQPGASSLALGTLTQAPTLPGTLQDLQVPVQELLQQTASTQKLLKHSVLAAHPAPKAFLHTPAPLQTVPPF
jgi:hypothetical protein